jgi:hypothetical protein
MKKSMFVVLVVMALALFPLSGNAQVVESDVRSFVLTNDLNGDLIQRLIANGCSNLYQALVFLAAQPGSGIPADFVTEVGNAPAGSEVFTDSLSNYAGPNENPVGINADGTAIIADFLVQDYDGHPGFMTNTVQYAGVGPVRFTMATSSPYYIYLGSTEWANPWRVHNYYAPGIAWPGAAAPPVTATATPVPTLSEWGMILLSLAMAGAALFYMKKRQRDAG